MSKHAYVFPGQGSQFSGMGKALYDSSETAKALFEQANEILGFRISDTMFGGTDEELKQTSVTQPAVFIHSVAAFKTLGNIVPDMVAGHSLGEFSALVANGALSFEDGLKLVSIRATAMQKACDLNPSMMAAILALDDKTVIDICKRVQESTGEIVVAANFNSPGQVVISGSNKAIEVACKEMLAAGAKRAMPLHVGGAFHSPLMASAEEELKQAIENTSITSPSCPIYQNVVAKAISNTDEIRENLIRQLTGSVYWTQSILEMVKDGATHFTETGPGKVLLRVISKIHPPAIVDAVS